MIENEDCAGQGGIFVVFNFIPLIGKSILRHSQTKKNLTRMEQDEGASQPDGSMIRAVHRVNIMLSIALPLSWRRAVVSAIDHYLKRH